MMDKLEFQDLISRLSEEGKIRAVAQALERRLFEDTSFEDFGLTEENVRDLVSTNRNYQKTKYSDFSDWLQPGPDTNFLYALVHNLMIKLCLKGGHFVSAADIAWKKLGDWNKASELYKQGRAFYCAARLEGLRGNDRAAMELYEKEGVFGLSLWHARRLKDDERERFYSLLSDLFYTGPRSKK